MIVLSLVVVVTSTPHPLVDVEDGPSLEPPQDAVMGDGLRLYDLPQPGETETRATTCAAGSVQKGIDISKWQADVDWTKIANDGVKFAFVRVSDGLNSKDQKFDRNWEHSRAAGIYTGVYQFFRPNQNVRGQADYLLEKMGCDMTAKTCPWTDMDLPPVIDVEYRPNGWSKTSMRNAIREWIDRVEEFGAKPVVYSGRYFWRDYVDSTEWSDHPFWIAHYTNGCPNIPTHWSNWTVWQYTESGSVSGVNGNTDMNQFNGSMDMIRALSPGDGGQQPPPPPPNCGLVAFDDLTVIDNGDSCFQLFGPQQYWRTESAGYNDDLNWTRSTNGTEYNYAVWSLSFMSGGEYGVQAYVDSDFSTASVAKYIVTHANGNKTASIDQRPGGWIDLGTFDFKDGAEQQVRLADKSGASGQNMVFDAIRIFPDGIDPDDCGEGPHSPRTDESDWDVDRGGGEQSCRVSGPSAPGWWSLVLVPLFFARRRR